MTQPTMINPETLLAQTDWLRFLARQLVRDPQAQEDLVQETYLQTLRHPPADAARTGPFMTRVMRRLAQRRGTRESRRRQLESLASQPKQTATPEELTQRVMVQRDLVDALLAMPEAQRSVLILRYYEDLGPQEIARRLNIPLATAKSRQQRGIQELRATLTRQYGDEAGLRRALSPLAALAVSTEARVSASAVTAWSVLKMTAAVLVVGLTVWSVSAFMDEPPASGDLAADDLASAGEASKRMTAPRRQQPSTADTSAASVINHDARPQLSVTEESPLLAVVDADGKGVSGVPVSIESSMLGSSRISWTGVSKGSSGGVALGEAASLLQDENSCELHHLTLGFPVLGSPRVAFEPGKGLKKSTRLLMPKTGSVELTLVDENGEPAAGRFSVVCGGSPPALLKNNDKGFLTPFKGVATDSTCTIPHVGLNLSLVVFLEDKSGRRGPVREVIAGPTKPGQVVKKALRLPAPYPTIRGRLRGPAGMSFAACELKLVLSEKTADKVSASPWTARRARPVVHDLAVGEDGSFEFIWPDVSEAGSAFRLIIGEEISRNLDAHGLSAEVAVTKQDASAPVDLGDIVLARRGKCVLTGRVVDEAGRAIVGAKLRQKKQTGSAGRGRMISRRSSGVCGFGRSTTTGTFEVYGSATDKTVLLEVEAAGFFTAKDLAFDLGQSAADIVLKKAGRVSGSIKLESPLDAWTLKVWSVRKEEIELGGTTRIFPRRSFPVTVKDQGIGRDGRFTLTDLPAGEIDIEFEVGDRVVKKIEKVVVEAGKTIAPAQLQDISLGRKPRVLRVVLHDENGVPLAGRSVFSTRVHQGRFSSQTSRVKYSLDQEGSFFASDLGVDAKEIDLMVKGFKPVNEKIEGDLLSLQLVAGPRVLFEVPFDSIAVAEGEVLTLVVAPDFKKSGFGGRGAGLATGIIYRVDVLGSQVLVEMSEGGDFVAELRTMKAGSRRGKPVKGLSAKQITVKPGRQTVVMEEK